MKSQRKGIEALFYLEAGEFMLLLPFMAIYTLCFAALILWDNANFSQLVTRLSPQAWPQLYALNAALSMVAVACYRKWVHVDRIQGMMLWILIITALMILFYALLIGQDLKGDWVIVGGFVGRDVAMNMLLLHFGSFIQEFFSRKQLSRILAIIYAGGRIGGIFAGFMVARFAATWGLSPLVALGAFLLLLALVLTRKQCAKLGPLSSAFNSSGKASAQQLNHPQGAPKATETVGPAASHLYLALALSTGLFVLCRWLLFYRYSAEMTSSFGDPVEMAQFMGQYTQWALMAALLIQLLGVSRLIHYLGLNACHGLYNLCLLLAFVGLSLWPGLAMATAARFAENELRFALRNPVNQLYTNFFSRNMRLRVRSMILGAINPMASAVVAGMAWLGWIHSWGLAAALLTLYMAASLFLYQSTKNMIRQEAKPATS